LGRRALLCSRSGRSFERRQASSSARRCAARSRFTESLGELFFTEDGGRDRISASLTFDRTAGASLLQESELQKLAREALAAREVELCAEAERAAAAAAAELNRVRGDLSSQLDSSRAAEGSLAEQVWTSRN